MMFFVKRLLLMVLLLSNNQTLNGTPIDNDDPSTKSSDIAHGGMLNWVPIKWCKNRYDELFGNNGVVTSIVSSIFGRPKKQPIECCCHLLSENDQSTPESPRNEVRGVPNDNDTQKKSNKCVNVVGKVFAGAGGCVLGVGWVCSRFVVDACKEIGAVTGGLIYGAVLACAAVGKCFECGGSKPKPPKKKNSQKET